jgi:hypothetical protein
MDAWSIFFNALLQSRIVTFQCALATGGINPGARQARG